MVRSCEEEEHRCPSEVREIGSDKLEEIEW